MLVVAVDVLKVDHHVQSVGQDEEQNQRSDETHKDGWGEKGGAVTGRSKFIGQDVEGLNLEVRTANNNILHVI